MKNKFRKFLLIALIAAMSISTVGAAQAQTTDDYSIDGGRLVIDFDDPDDINRFSCYTEFGDLPYAVDGRAYCSVLAEQKMILAGMIFEDVRVDVDIYTLGSDGKFDSGIYIGASGAKNVKDGITAWQVNIEHAVDASTFWLKLHRFENDRWLRDELVEIGGLPFTKEYMHLTVTVKSGILSAFLDYSSTPTVTKDIGDEARGMVGIRNFYAPCSFDNFTVVGDAIEVDTNELTELMEKAKAKAKENILQSCKVELDAAIALAESAKTQAQCDAAVSALKSALDRALTKRTLSELAELTQRADAIVNTDGKVYTGNSYASLTAVKDICAALTAEDGDYEIAYWYARLDERMKNLIKYDKEVLQ